MADDNPELQSKLKELDLELEEGEITQKGGHSGIQFGSQELIRTQDTRKDGPSSCPNTLLLLVNQQGACAYIPQMIQRILPMMGLEPLLLRLSLKGQSLQDRR